jgi:putative NIF3 family GTP cyclohydrolase 1 type 2
MEEVVITDINFGRIKELAYELWVTIDQYTEKMAIAGIGTIVAMHQSEEHWKMAKESHINVIVAGHTPSDSLGMNLFLDELEKRGIEIIPCSGLIRVSRIKK